MSMMLAARSACVCRNTLRTQVTQITRRRFQAEAAKFFEKHAKRSSPLSPSLAVLMKNMPLTATLSITHRITGMGVGLILYGIGISELCYSHLSFEQILAKVKSAVPDFFLQFVKIATATSIAFHTFNGVRHLSWDAGLGFKLKTLYRSGYLVLALTALAFAHIVTRNN